MMMGLALRPSWPYVGEVARSLLGVVLAVAVALHWGSTTAAIAAGGSAAIAGATALQDGPRGRLPMVVAVSLSMGAAVFLGALSAPNTTIFVVVVALWCFAAGLAWTWGANAGLVAAAATALLVTASAAPQPLAEVVTATILTVAGGLTQAVLVTAWPRQRWQVQRLALTNAYRSVARHARLLATEPVDAAGSTVSFDPTPLISLREAFTLSDRQARRRPPAYRGLYGLPERIAMTLAALGRSAGTPEVATVLAAAADVLDGITGSGRGAHDVTQRELHRLDEAVAALTGSPAVAGRRLHTQLWEAATLRFTGAAVPAGTVQELRRPPLSETVSAGRAALMANLRWESPILRHGVRLAGAAAIGTAAARVGDLPRGYWIALTMVLVLRPETAHTYTRCITRIAGTAVGITVATGVTLLAHPAGLVSAVLAVVFVGVAYAVAGIGYAALSAALAAAIVFLLDISGTADSATIQERLVATILGGALAVTSHLLLPDRSLIRLRQRAGELLKAEIDYAATVLRAFVHPVPDLDTTLAAAWQRATRARSAFEAASGGVRTEAPDVRRWLTVYRAALNAVTGACATLESHLPTPDVAVDRRFVVAVDDYVDSLRGDTPSAGQPWEVDTAHLAEADQQLRDAAALLTTDNAAQRVLLAEVATITRHLLAVTPPAGFTRVG
ncbi:FUSC family protein [soil metagenome]